MYNRNVILYVCIYVLVESIADISNMVCNELSRQTFMSWECLKATIHTMHATVHV